MKNKKLLKKSLFFALGLGVAGVAVSSIAAACNNKKQEVQKSNKEKAVDYMESEFKEIVAKAANNSASKAVVDSILPTLRTQMTKQIDDMLAASNKSDLTNEEFEQFKKTMDQALSAIPSL